VFTSGDGRAYNEHMTSTTFTTDDILDMISDIADELCLDYDLIDQTFSNFAADWEPTKVISAREAADAIARTIAANMSAAEEHAMDFAMGHMASDDGWQFENHSMVLWTEDGAESDTLVVWLGNVVDFAMVDVARCPMA
jgi:hypothetical protein